MAFRVNESSWFRKTTVGGGDDLGKMGILVLNTWTIWAGLCLGSDHNWAWTFSVLRNGHR
jgi:hypothetical protein